MTLPRPPDDSTLIELLPADVHNRALLSHVHPHDWVNPEPATRYNLVVIGAGTAGLVAAAAAAGLGARVALIERHLMGGDCLNYGCVPSKSIIRAGRAAASVRGAGEFGVTVPTGWTVDFGAAMQRMRPIRALLGRHDSAARFRDLGVDVFLGEARFSQPDRVEVAGKELRFSKAVIATGAQARVPTLPGLAEIDYLTNESVFSLSELPRRFGIIGAGPIGCELAQSFARLGSEVLLVEASDTILSREDPDAVDIVKKSLVADGVQLFCHARSIAVRKGAEQIHLSLQWQGQPCEQTVDKLLIAVGRKPNVEGLNLEAAGVAYDVSTGVIVDDMLRTTNARVFAAGDVCSPHQFTHAADFMARIVVRNALFMGRAKVSRLTIPRCTYTSPEIGQVGICRREAEIIHVCAANDPRLATRSREKPGSRWSPWPIGRAAINRRLPLDSYTQEFAGVDRAMVDGQTEGFVRIHVKRGTDRILGATIVAVNAGDLISQLTLAMSQGLGLKKIAETIYCYPTQAEAIRRVGDLYNRSRLTPLAESLLRRWFAWTR